MEIKNQLLYSMKSPATVGEADTMVHNISTFLLNNGYDYSDDYAESIKDYRNRHPGEKVHYWVEKEINKKLPLHSDICKNCSYFCNSTGHYKLCSKLDIATEPNFFSCAKFRIRLKKQR